METLDTLEIQYSPYFIGKPFVRHSKHDNQVLLGTATLSDIGLLCRLELIAGLSFPGEEFMPKVEEKRVAAYFDLLKATLTDTTHPLYRSFSLDLSESADNATYRITTELLRWRDELILAGWDQQNPLPGKLSAISSAEAKLPADSVIRMGEADRWKNLLAHTDQLKDGVGSLQCQCPKVLVKPLIAKLLEDLDAGFSVSAEAPTLNTAHCSIISVPELYMAYEWLSAHEVDANDVVICNDPARLDSVLWNFRKPTLSKATSRNHAYHVCSLVDAPQTLIWLDCMGDYGLHYPYEMLSHAEMEELTHMGCTLPTKPDMLSALDALIITHLNSAEKVILLSPKRDNGDLLLEHPIISTLLNIKDTEVTQLEYSLSETLKEEPCQTFQKATSYQVKEMPEKEVVMSYSSLDQLIQHPFNFAVERELGLWQPNSETDLRTEEGNVAHKVVELLVNAGKSLTDGTAFNDTFQQALAEVDAKELVKPENLLECNSFRTTLQRSIGSLQSIIENNGLTPVTCEYAIDDISIPLFPKSKAKAKIDMLLYNRKEKYYVIIDFKYSTSVNTHPSKLAKNKSIQFAVYQQIFNAHADALAAEDQDINGNPPAHVQAMGYYLIPLETLFVPDGEMGSKYLKGEHVVAVERERKALDNMENRLTKSYEKRLEQIRQGVLEEGAGGPLEALPYYKDENYTELFFPLEPDYNKKNNKADSYNPTHIVLKNQIR